MIKLENENKEIEKKEQEYAEYIREHVNNVKKAFDEMCNLDDPEVLKYVNELQTKINEHDLSKWSEEEFDAYRKNFFPVDSEEKELNEQSFEEAWKHHYTVNDHHWQYWLDSNGENLKPFNEQNERKLKLACLEMICDWQGMGYKFGDTAYQYYKSHENEIKLYPQLKDWIINVMKQLDK